MKSYLRPLKKIYKRSKNRLFNNFHNPSLILLYHRVCDLEFDPQLLSVSPKNFKDQLLILKERYQIRTLSEIFRSSTVAITFDDGYADNFLHALPILEETKVNATFFISTGQISSSKEFWWDELENQLLNSSTMGEFHLNGQIWNIVDDDTRINLYHYLHRFMKTLNYAERESVFDQLAKFTGKNRVARNTHRALSIEELQEFASSPYVTIGAHTVNHCPLSSLTLNEQKSEIVESKIALEKLIHRPIDFFSYPFGTKKDYDKNSYQIAKDNFTLTTSNFPGLVYSWTDKHALPRHLVRNWETDPFISHIEGFWKY